MAVPSLPEVSEEPADVHVSLGQFNAERLRDLGYEPSETNLSVKEESEPMPEPKAVRRLARSTSAGHMPVGDEGVEEEEEGEYEYEEEPVNAGPTPLRELYAISDETIPEEVEKPEEEENLGGADIPPRIAALLTSRDPLTVAALQGASLVGYSASKVRPVVADVRRLLQKCTAQGLLEESVYVKAVLDAVKGEACERRAPPRISTAKLDAVRAELAEREREFARAMAAVNADRQLAMEAVDARLAEDAAALEAEWASDRKMSAYNKPSPALLKMRATAQKMLSVCRFEDAARLAAKIAEKEAEESEEASYRMAEDFRAALARLKAAAEAEREAVNRQAEGKRLAIERKGGLILIPLRNRVQMLRAASGKVREVRGVEKPKIGRPQFGKAGPPVSLGAEKLILKPLPASAKRTLRPR
jgi:hypothetical protein